MTSKFPVHFRRLALALIFTLSLSARVGARAAADDPLNADLRSRIVEKVCEAIQEHYVFPDVADKMAEKVKGLLAQGAYDEISDRDALAARLTDDLRSVSKDLHLHVNAIPPDALGPGGSDEDRQRRRAEMREQMRRGNFGFEKIERLSGNVGYLDLRGFVPAEVGGETAVAAMNFLANSDAVIIDLRQNGGGDPSMIQLISSYFFEAPTHLNSFYIRAQDSLRQFWTSAYVQGRRMSGVDLYVLTSNRTFSAAEEFTYNMKNLKRATIIGETTGGGAHPTDFHAFPELRIGVSVPFGRAINPITGTNWEGTGVSPDIEVSRDKALGTAHLMALDKLGEKADDERTKSQLKWIRETIQARLEPLVLDESLLLSYAGQYGPRVLTFVDGRLNYQRGQGLRYVLTPIGPKMFVPDGMDEFRLEVETDAEGRPVALIGHYPDGRSDRTPRTDG